MCNAEKGANTILNADVLCPPVVSLCDYYISVAPVSPRRTEKFVNSSDNAVVKSSRNRRGTELCLPKNNTLSKRDIRRTRVCRQTRNGVYDRRRCLAVVNINTTDECETSMSTRSLPRVSVSVNMCVGKPTSFPSGTSPIQICVCP